MTYTTLTIIWFALWAILWAVYFMLDGFDLGVGILYPFIAKNETEQRHLLNTIGPFWDGNEVWLVTAGGATFAAFPNTYATMFSYLYLPLMLILLGLIFRGTAIEFMNKGEGNAWRTSWKWAFFVGSILVSFVFGVAFANIFQGLPIDQNGYQGTFLGLLNFYGVLGGIVFISLFSLSGAVWIAFKNHDPLLEKAINYASKIWFISLITLIMFFISTKYLTNIYSNYSQSLILILVPLITIISFLLVTYFIRKKEPGKAFLANSVVILGLIFTGLIGIFPNMIPSSIDSVYSLTIFNSRSSEYTLNIMFYVALIFVPIVIAYQIFVYKIFSFKVTDKDTHY